MDMHLCASANSTEHARINLHNLQNAATMYIYICTYVSFTKICIYKETYIHILTHTLLINGPSQDVCLRCRLQTASVGIILSNNVFFMHLLFSP